MILDTLLNPQLWSSTLTLGIPIALGALCGTFSERSGIINISIEGTMLMSAFFAVFFADVFQNPWMGVLGGLVAGIILSMIFAYGSINLAADQVVLGMAVNILSLGLTTYLLNSIYGFSGTPIDVPSLPVLEIPLIKDIPFLGPIISDKNALFYTAILLFLAAHYFLFKTNLGLRIRAVGENPEAVATAGLNVFKLRYLGVFTGSIFASLGGAFLSIGVLNSFDVNMTNGKGYIALAAMIFGRWTPLGSFGAAMLFGFATALSMHIQNVGISKNIIQMLPYILTILALVGIGVKSVPPAAEGEPYTPEEE